MELERLVFARNSHPLSDKAYVRAEDLIAFPWLLFRETVFLREAIEAYFAEGGIAPPCIAGTTTSLQSALAMMSGNNYLMLLPDTFLPEEPELENAPLRLARSVGSYEAGLIYRPSLGRIPAFATFRELLIEESAPVSQNCSERTTNLILVANGSLPEGSKGSVGCAFPSKRECQWGTLHSA